MTIYLGSRRDAEAYAYFSARAADFPERPLFRALAGMFQLRMAGQVTLTDRIAWVERAMDELDRAAAEDASLPRVLRAAAFARLPSRFGVAESTAVELQALLQDPTSAIHAPQLPATLRAGLERSAWQALAHAHATAGRAQASADALRRSGAASLDDNTPTWATGYSVTAEDGFRFGKPAIAQIAPSVYVARGFDFADIAFIETADGIVAIDAGTTPRTAAAALDAFRRQVSAAPIRTVILTHAHWDHIGGLDAFAADRPWLVAQQRFAAELERVNSTGVPFRFFFGADVPRNGARTPFVVQPDQLIDGPTSLLLGGVDLRLIPVSGGETEDALIIDLPALGVTFVGDVLMPYLGAPFLAEGSPTELLSTLRTLRDLGPRHLVHGHVPLSDFYTAETLAPLEAALAELVSAVTQGIRDGLGVDALIGRAILPGLLQEYPHAVLPFLLMRDHVIQRLHRSRTGYWQSGGEGLELHSRAAWGAALDLIARGSPEPFVEAATSLVARGDHALALEIAGLALERHPGDPALAALRARALDGLRERYQQVNPFKLIIYSEMAGTELPPLP